MKPWIALAWFAVGLAASAGEPVFQPPQRGPALPADFPKLPGNASPVFWQRTVDFHDGQTPAWLVGYGAAGAVVVDTAGNLIARAPAVLEGYDDGFIARLGPERFAWVLASPAGRRLSSTVSVFLLDDPPTLAFSYESPAKGPRWNSTLYLVDANDDGQPDLLVDREVYLEGRRTHEQLVYRFSEKHRDFRPAITPRGWMAKAAAAARLNPAVPRVVQYTERFAELR